MSSLTIKMVVSSAKRTVELEGSTEGRSLMKWKIELDQGWSPGGPQKKGSQGKSNNQEHE